MLLYAAMALAMSWPWSKSAPPEPLSGLEADAVVQQVHRRCPVLEPKVSHARTAGLLGMLDAFRAQLSGPARSMLDRRLAGTGCESREGASCHVDAYLAALRETRLTDAFTMYLCGRGQRLR